MNSVLPAVTALDAVGAIVAVLVMAGVAVAAFARAPRDIRTRTFLVVAVTSVLPYLLTPLQWLKGPEVYTPGMLTLAAVSFCVGSVALFHFSQVFPSRRPWITAHGRWLVAAYALLAPPVAVITWTISGLIAAVAAAESGTGSGGLGAVSADVAEAVLLLAVPVIFIAAVVLPFAGLLSLLKSWQEARNGGSEAARISTLWILISQMAGGVLSVLVVPLLHLVGITGIWSSIVAVLAYAFALLMPLAFAAAVWKYRLLEGVSTSA